MELDSLQEQVIDFSVDRLLPLGKAGLSFLIGVFITWLFFKAYRSYASRRDSLLLDAMREHLRAPVYWLIPLLCTLALTYVFGVRQGELKLFNVFITSSLYVTLGWLLVRGADVLSDILMDRYRKIGSTENTRTRRIVTQFTYFKKVIISVVILIVLALILLQFEEVRKLGAGILTSAGVAGIIIGLAAQKSIANLLAGFQLAFTQPIRIGDAVIVENEFGFIDEITLTYVVVAIWDDRRLVVPLNYFNERPFQNWTRENSKLLTYVNLYLDYRMPIEPLRKQLTQCLQATDLWDRRVNKIQVIDSDQQTMCVRLLMSAESAPVAWSLKCHIREQLITFIQQEYLECLPRTRFEMQDRGEQVFSSS